MPEEGDLAVPREKDLVVPVEGGLTAEEDFAVDRDLAWRQSVVQYILVMMLALLRSSI